MPHRVNKEVLSRSVQSVPIATGEDGSVIKNYTEEDVEDALHHLANFGGNVNRTRVFLEQEKNLYINNQILTRWARFKFAQRYSEIQTKLRATIGETVAAKLSENASQAADLNQEILDRLAENVYELDVKELPGAAKAMAQTASINIEKSLLLRGQPTDIVATRSPEEILRELKRLGAGFKDEPITVENEE